MAQLMMTFVMIVVPSFLEARGIVLPGLLKDVVMRRRRNGDETSCARVIGQAAQIGRAMLGRDDVDVHPSEGHRASASRSEEHTSELQPLMRISYAVLCLTKHTTKMHKCELDST